MNMRPLSGPFTIGRYHMAGEYGMKETKELLKFVIGLGMAIDKSLADKKFSFDDVTYFMVPLMQAGPAFANIKMLPAELKDMDAAEAAELKQFIEDEFDIENDKIEKIIEAAIGVGLKVYEIMLSFKKKPAA